MYTVKFMFDYGADSCLWGTEDEGLLSMQSFPISSDFESIKRKIRRLERRVQFYIELGRSGSGICLDCRANRGFSYESPARIR